LPPACRARPRGAGGPRGMAEALPPHVAFPPSTVARQAGEQWLTVQNGGRCIAQNQINNGEMWMKNAAALPRKDRFHKKADFDEDWYLRNSGRERQRVDIDFRYYNESPLLKKHFNAGAIGKDHSRRVFQELAHFNRAHSEGSLLALREDKELQKEMAKRYNKVMRSKPLPPAPNRPSPPPLIRRLPPFRESSTPARASRDDGKAGVSEGPHGVGRGAGASPSRAAKGVAEDANVPTHVEAEASAWALRPREEGERPRAGSALSQSRPVGSALSATAPSRSQVALSQVSAAQPDLVSAVHPSQLSVSDYFSWRPRLIS